ncbi:unnamed protein product [Mytilus edulis]|uniref:Uncharacterized protein n=1 Tax=Mytilus edulis TaxID=6550 RepID=A0A8S3TXY3_MYTED|nr:unnamed protein product [Mytilus edulis]
MENGQSGIATNDCWLIQRLINILVKSKSSKHRIDISAWTIEGYIMDYGCEQFVNRFNEKLAEWFQSEQNVLNCELYLIDFYSSKSFTMENGQIGTATNDCWLIQRLINILTKSESSQHGVDIPARTIERYIKKYGREQFINRFNEKLAECFQSEQNVLNCELYVIDYFIRPSSFTIENGQIGTAANDCWLIQRLINILMKSESSQHGVDIPARTIERYIKEYGCEQFVNSFNGKLAECFQSEKNLANCKLSVIDYFIRPTSFTIEIGQIGTFTNDRWLIQRFINILMKQKSSKHPVDISAWNIERYIKDYGCEQFVNRFNENLQNGFNQSKMY